MKRIFVVAAAIVLLGFGADTQANVFDMGAGRTSMQFVDVGDPGNMMDTYWGNNRGAVGYSYRMGKYEVTAAQYVDFLNKVAKDDPNGLYSIAMGGSHVARSGASGSYSYSVPDDYANRPIDFVSFPSACRLCNWLQNGQPTGPQNASTTESGAYNLVGVAEKDIARSPGAKYYLPNSNEWYKAAYYKGGGTDAGYWHYPTCSDERPSNVFVDPDPGNHATYYYGTYTLNGPYYTTNVGEYENSAGPYGTFDMAGNVWEWSEDAYTNSYSPYRYPLVWGGGWGSGFSSWSAEGPLLINYTTPGLPYGGRVYCDVGFRIAAAVPEPSSILVIFTGLAGATGFGFRRRM